MSQISKYMLLTGTPIGTITAGGTTVGPDALGNINLANGNNITCTGNAGTNTVTVNVSGTTDNTLQLGNATGSLTSLGVATHGQIPIGSTGASPVLSTITAGTGVTITNAAGSITINAGGVNQNIIYVGKHGNDANDGFTIEKAKLTFGAAITAAFAIAPTYVVCLDAGVYVENLTGQIGVAIFAPNATISGAHTLASVNRWTFDSAAVATGTIGFSYNAGGVGCHLDIKTLECTGTGIGIVSLAGTMYANIINAQIGTGYLIGPTTADAVMLNIDTLSLGAGTAFGVAAGALVSVVANAIQDAGAGTLVYSAAVALANVEIVVTSIDIENLSNISVPIQVVINAAVLAGTNAEIGAGTVLRVGGATCIDGVPIGAQIRSTGDFTVVTTTTALDVAYGGTGIASPTDHTLLVGSGIAAMTALAIGATNQVLLGNTAADPSWGTVGNAALTNSSVTLSDGNNITVTGSPLSLGGTASFNLTGTTQYCVQVGDATGSLDSLAIGSAGQVLVSGGAGANPAWTTSTIPTTAAIGDIIYASALNTLSMLAFDATATRYLSNTGGGATIPAWDQINLANGVSGTLPVGNGGLGVADPTDHCVLVGSGNTAVTPITVGATGELLCGISGADPDFASSSDGDFAFTSATAAVQRTLTVSNTDNTAALSPANVQVTVGGETNTGDPFINFLVSGSDTYSVGIDNSVAGNPLKITSGASPSAGTDLISMTSAGVITLNNDLDVSEGGTGVSTLTSHGILLGNGAGDIQALAEATNGQIPIGSTGGNPVLALPTNGTNISWTGGAGTLQADLVATVGVTLGGTGATTFTAYAVLCGGTTATNPIQSIAGVGTASQVLTSNGAGALPTFQDPAAGGMAWENVTDATKAMVADTGYVANRAAGVLAFTLPATATVGEVFAIAGSQNGWTIAQNAGQTIHFLGVDTTTGAGGSVASTTRYDCIKLVCIVTDNNFVVRSATGNLILT